MFKKIHNVVMKSHIGNKPAWMEDPDQSAICVLSKHELDNMEEEDVQELFCIQHIVVCDQFQPELVVGSHTPGSCTTKHRKQT